MKAEGCNVPSSVKEPAQYWLASSRDPNFSDVYDPDLECALESIVVAVRGDASGEASDTADEGVSATRPGVIRWLGSNACGEVIDSVNRAAMARVAIQSHQGRTRQESRDSLLGQKKP
jgi:hypothetical protein